MSIRYMSRFKQIEPGKNISHLTRVSSSSNSSKTIVPRKIIEEQSVFSVSLLLILVAILLSELTTCSDAFVNVLLEASSISNSHLQYQDNSSLNSLEGRHLQFIFLSGLLYHDILIFYGPVFHSR
jgi:hypothetical protein